MAISRTLTMWTYLVLERLAHVHVELLYAAGVQVVKSQNLVSFVEQAHGLWLASPPGHTVTHTYIHTCSVYSILSVAFIRTVFDISPALHMTQMRISSYR